MADTQHTPPKPRRLWKIVFVFSLALNLLVAGVVGGTLLSGRIGDGPPRSFDLGVGPVAKALSPQERRSVGRTLRQSGALREMNTRGHAAEMAAILQAETFEPEALRAVFAEQSADILALQQRAQDALVATIAAMSPERRAAFAAEILAEIERGNGPRRSGG